MRHSLPPIRDRKIRFAIVGCGRIAKNHFDAIQSYTDHAEIVSVCDIDPSALDKAATQTQAQAYTTLPSLLDDTTADIVVLTTPSGFSTQIFGIGASNSLRKNARASSCSPFTLYLNHRAPLQARWVHGGWAIIKSHPSMMMFITSPW